MDFKKRLKELERENNILDAKIMEIYALYNISKRLNMSLQLDEIFNGTMDHISESLEMDDFCVLLFDDNREDLVISASHSTCLLEGVSFAAGEGVSGKVALSGEARLIQDVGKCEDFLFYKGKKMNIGSFYCVPLKKDEDVLGVLNVHKQKTSGFDEKSCAIFNEVAEQIAIAVHKALAFRDMKELAIRDELTGLYNRRYFFDTFEREMSRAKRYEREISVIICDIDNFKNFNDTHGHLMGDKLLKAFSDILVKNVRQSDVVARMGGEEFIIALVETPKEFSIRVAEKLRNAVENEKFEGEESQPGGRLTATFGLASFPYHADFATELVDCADKALYYGKDSSRNVAVSYDIFNENR